MKVTNTQPGPRGINTVNGPVLIEPKETAEVQVYAREKEHLEAAGWFTIDGDYTADPGSAASALNDAASDASKENEDLKKQIAELRTKLEAAEKAVSEAGNSNQTAALKAEHHGGGKFNVTQGEAVLLSGLSKADADAFNAMSAEDKAAYVDASKK